jgi:nitroimidazol reductase NimA-like FMN-containing flavoprotein (pyridoxamine 5'-phosphate oxidase superfamily)
LIQELSRQASLELLARMRLGRLACAQGTQPYVVPFYFAYHDDCLYSFSTIGQKIEWMRANPLVCVEADEVASPEQWASVVVFGRYEELPDTPEWQSARTVAHTLLKRSAVWWEPAYVKTVLHGTPRPLVPVFYRIHIVRITGHSATPEPGAPPDNPGEQGWLRTLLRQVRRTFTQCPERSRAARHGAGAPSARILVRPAPRTRSARPPWSSARPTEREARNAPDP